MSVIQWIFHLDISNGANPIKDALTPFSHHIINRNSNIAFLKVAGTRSKDQDYQCWDPEKNQSDETTFISEHPGVEPAQASRDTFVLKKVDITTTRRNSWHHNNENYARLFLNPICHGKKVQNASRKHHFLNIFNGNLTERDWDGHWDPQDHNLWKHVWYDRILIMVMNMIKIDMKMINITVTIIMIIIIVRE